MPTCAPVLLWFLPMPVVSGPASSSFSPPSGHGPARARPVTFCERRMMRPSALFPHGEQRDTRGRRRGRERGRERDGQTERARERERGRGRERAKERQDIDGEEASKSCTHGHTDARPHGYTATHPHTHTRARTHTCGHTPRAGRRNTAARETYRKATSRPCRRRPSRPCRRGRAAHQPSKPDQVKQT